MVLPVTDDRQRVTDPVVKRVVEKAGMDVDYVEFHDYDRTRPYAKLYVDRKSDKRILVASGLPMVRKDDGSKLVPGWESTGTGYAVKNNLFQCEVVGGRIALAPTNDQPWGMTVRDEMVWEPVLYVGREEVKYKSVTILPADPWNPNYHDNVLEYDYGVCKRRVRVIEGRLRERWVFGTNPGGEVRIVHNTGTWKPKLGTATGPDDTPVPVKVADGDVEVYEGPYPAIIGASATFYPDADPESTSVDGAVQHSVGGITWSDIRNGAGTYGPDDVVGASSPMIRAGTGTGMWQTITRSIFLFDTSSLPDGATISAATLSIRSYSKGDLLGISPTVNIYSSAPASNTSLAAGDYDSLGTTEYSSSISYASWNTAGYNDFILNSSGLATINTTGVSKFGEREATYDAPDVEPSWSEELYSYFGIYFADKGTNYKPKLAVTYTPPAGPARSNYYRRRRSA